MAGRLSTMSSIFCAALALGIDRFPEFRTVLRKGVAAPGLAEALQQNFIAGMQEYDFSVH